MENEAIMFRALGNGIRLNILMAIHEQSGNWINVGEIQQITGYTQATVSQHLSKLRDSKTVETQREGTKVYYRISEPMVKRVLSNIKK